MFESIIMSAAVRRGSEMREKEQEHLADMITNRVVKAWNDGQKKSK